MTGIITVARGEGGGAESVLEHLAQGWANPKDLLVVAPEGSRVQRIAAGVGAHTLTLPARKDTIGANLLGVLRLLPALRSCSILHAWSSRTFELAYVAGTLTGAKVTGTQHDHPAALYINPRRQRVMRWAANRLGTLVCVSQAVKVACRQAGYRVPIQVIPNGVWDFGQTRPMDGPVRVGFLGMHDPDKGFAVIRPWIERLLRTTDVQFELYGSVTPELRSSIEAFVGQEPARVRLRGWRSTTEVFREIDVLIHASLKFETFGMVLAEAACAGIPVVASVRGAEGEIVNHEETGFLFPAERPEVGLSYLERLIREPALRHRMGAQARRRYEILFTAARMAAGYQELWVHG
jgi:glycosyltransferase involved in cell wall biosynthesis